VTVKRPPSARELAQITPLSMKNPYIMNFCRVLVEKKGEKHSPESLKKLLNDMYRLFENLLGQNMVKALPEDKREEYLRLCEDLRSKLSGSHERNDETVCGSFHAESKLRPTRI
jgi:hypothetical protein